MLIEAGALQLDDKVDFESTHKKQQIVETNGIALDQGSAIVKTVPMPVSGVRDNIVSNTVAENQKNAMPSEKVVSSTVTANQKISAPRDNVVSSTVAANQARAMQSPSSAPTSTATVAPTATATATPTKAVAAPAAPAAATTGRVAVVTKSAKGFYKKPTNPDDENCPVEEECEL